MPLPQIIALLRETLGLDVAFVGVRLIEHAVKRRVNANDLQDFSQYAGLLPRSQFGNQYIHKTDIAAKTLKNRARCVLERTK
jgi:hypothetical protein